MLCSGPELQKKGIDIISHPGDGDTRLRKYQWGPIGDFSYMKSGAEIFCSNIEIGLDLGFSTELQFAMQDCPHAIKKMRNCIKYPNKCMSMANSENAILPFKNFTLKWDHIFRLYEESSDFQDRCARSAVLLTDKQDPSAVSDLAYCYDLFYKHGYQAMGLF